MVTTRPIIRVSLPLFSISKWASYSLAVLRSDLEKRFLDLHHDNVMYASSPLSFLFSYAVSDTESMTEPSHGILSWSNPRPATLLIGHLCIPHNMAPGDSRNVGVMLILLVSNVLQSLSPMYLKRFRITQRLSLLSSVLAL
jgi:hypothetical protein